jgi:membrane protein YdbS with pleckstrin-like domain
MEAIVMRPEKEQKTMWFIGWAVPFFIGSIGWIVLLAFITREEAAWWILALCFAGFLVVMGLILVWIPAFYKTLEYVIDSDSVKMKKGVFWKKNVTVPFAKITNVDVTQGPLQRAFDIGTIHVQTAGAGGQPGMKAELVMMGVRELDGTKETIMNRVRGYEAAVPEAVKEKAVEEGEQSVFERMLEELAAIRELLEKR